MLVLTRKANERIVIGKHAEIVVTVVRLSGDRVRLGIEADKATPVHREEVYQAIQREGER